MRILIVDDQRSARRVLRQILVEVPGGEVFEAGSLHEALAVADQCSPELFLLDIRLSEDPRDRGGLELLRRRVRRGADARDDGHLDDRDHRGA